MTPSTSLIHSKGTGTGAGTVSVMVDATSCGVTDEWLQGLWTYLIDHEAVPLFHGTFPLLPILTPPSPHPMDKSNSPKDQGSDNDQGSNGTGAYLVKLSPEIPVLHMSFQSIHPLALGALATLGIFVFHSKVRTTNSFPCHLPNIVTTSYPYPTITLSHDHHSYHPLSHYHISNHHFLCAAAGRFGVFPGSFSLRVRGLSPRRVEGTGRRGEPNLLLIIIIIIIIIITIDDLCYQLVTTCSQSIPGFPPRPCARKNGSSSDGQIGIGLSVGTR